MAIVVTEQEFHEWKASRVTQAFMKAIYNDREWLKEMLLAGTEEGDRQRDLCLKSSHATFDGEKQNRF